MREKLRVALLSLHFAEYACQLARGLSERCEVLLVLDEENTRNELGENWRQRFFSPSLQIMVLRRARTLGQAWSNFLLLRKALAEFQPQMIHCQDGGIRDELVPLLLMWNSVPLILTVHDPVPHLGADRKHLAFSRLSAYSALLRRLCSAAIVHGEALATMLAASDRQMKLKTFVVPHGVLGPDNVDMKTAWVNGNMLFFGRMQEYKGLGCFIAAIKYLADLGVPVRGVIAGRGPDLEHHRAAVADSRLFDVRERYIPASEAAELFINANAVVLPYVEGTQSGVAAMAVGYGRPIVATRVGAIPEIVRDRVNGLLVPPNAVADLANAMKALIDDQALARKLAINARQIGRGVLSWREIAAATTAVYKHAASMKGAAKSRCNASGETRP